MITLGAKIFAVVAILAGLWGVLKRQPGSLGVGACGAIILGMALAGAFDGW